MKFDLNEACTYVVLTIIVVLDGADQLPVFPDLLFSDLFIDLRVCFITRPSWLGLHACFLTILESQPGCESLDVVLLFILLFVLK